MGYNSYEVRGTEVYPLVSDDFEDFLPVFEIRGSEVFPTTFNERDDFGLPMFEVRDGYAHPTSFNEHDDFAFEVPHGEGDEDEDGEDADESQTANDVDLSLGDLAAIAAVGAGIFAGVKAYSHIKDRRRRVAELKTATVHGPLAPSLSAPPGWYSTPDGLRHWNGAAWNVAQEPLGQPAWHVAPAHAFGTAPQKTGQMVVTIAWILTVLTVGYMLPWAVAVTRRSTNSTATGLLCFFLGWTVVGWIMAMVMACIGRRAAHYSA